jgi:hypothetical protein
MKRNLRKVLARIRTLAPDLDAPWLEFYAAGSLRGAEPGGAEPAAEPAASRSGWGGGGWAL